MCSLGVAKHVDAETSLQDGYLGFCVIRPLPGSPVGRTVVKTFPARTDDGLLRSFGALREYEVHLSSFSLRVTGLAFQQQDRAVSACATTALWCAIQKTAPMEGLALATPAEITESASRYLLADGRALPSEGLNIHQLCEATRATGLSPLVVKSVSPEVDRAQLLGYLSSGFAPVLALESLGGLGHAVCGVGLKLGRVNAPADPNQRFSEAHTAVEGLYVHDDRLGPYASAAILPYTLTINQKARVVTAVSIQWPDGGESELAVLKAIVIPVPTKLRLTVSWMLDLGMPIASVVAQLLPTFGRKVTLSCSFATAASYLRRSVRFGLTTTGVYQLTSRTVLSRYLGVIHLSVGPEPLLDVLLDATEAGANPSVLATVQRMRLSATDSDELRLVAARLASPFVR
jgi:hypothetical protein